MIAILIILFASCTAGPINELANKHKIKPIIPNEKLFTNISKPVGILSSIIPSNFLIIYALNGPIIIAPKNIGIFAPTIKPIVPIVPAIPPLVS